MSSKWANRFRGSDKLTNNRTSRTFVGASGKAKLENQFDEMPDTSNQSVRRRIEPVGCRP
jgi:hypothetical protein